MREGVTRAPDNSKSKYPIPWIATYFITGLVLIIGSFVIVWYVSQFSSDYDYSDPDMMFLERIVLSPNPGHGDFTHLNGGNWQALCLIGWQGDLAKAIAVAKLPVATSNAVLAEYRSRAGDTDASEFTLIYTDKSGAAKALTHPHGFAFAREGQAACTTSTQSVLPLPAGRQY